jgi:hypothetical protein
MVLKRVMKATIASIVCSFGLSFAAYAFPGAIVGEEPGSDVILRSEPSLDAEEMNYGIVGDSVDILDDAIGSDGYTWYYVEIPAVGSLGWIRGDYIALEEDYPSAEAENDYYELSEEAWESSEEAQW